MRCWYEKGRLTVVRERLESFIKELGESVVTDRVPLEASAFVTDERLPLKATADLPRSPVLPGTEWGRSWQSAYFLLEGELPASHVNSSRSVLLADFGGEALVYREDGEPLFALTDASSMNLEYRKIHEHVVLPSGHCRLYVEAAANDLFGLTRREIKKTRNIPNAEGVYRGIFSYAYIGLLDQDVWDLYVCMDALFSLYKVLPPSSLKAVRVISSLFEAMKAYARDGVAAALDIVDKEIGKPSEASSLSTTVIGHAHIDTAWLWPIAETRRKVMRTFASQIVNLERYPEYVFGASSPQQYLWVKETHPELYGKIRNMIKAGRWELLGGMWIEPDCNLVSGESLVRQILEGKNFFMQEFGKDVRTCWIPDVFGYPASLPQILVKSGIPYFSTQKISWSLSNRFPYDSFIWEGIDGSRVLTHFLPEHTYNSDANFSSLRTGEENYLEKDRIDEFVTAAGIGDGGGGPKDQHIERVLLARDTEGVPKAAFGFVEDFFDRLASSSADLDTYRGELYLEFHRGTYTSQAANKRNNRIFEEALKPIEVLLSWMGEPERIKDAIHDGLTFQFHDILPGSCIGPVYRETDEGYRKIFSAFSSVVSDYIERSGCRDYAFCSSFGGKQGGEGLMTLSVFAFSPSSRPVLVRLPDASFPSGRLVADGRYEVQELDGVRYAVLPLTHGGWNTFSLSAAEPEEKRNNSSSLTLDNGIVRYEFDHEGHLTRGVLLESGFEFTYGGKGNVFGYYADEPHVYDAWDIEYYYQEMEAGKAVCVSAEPLASGPAFSALRFSFRVGSSAIEQDVILPRGSAALYFRTRVDWHEERRLLRVYFPCDHLADTCTCDIPYGQIERSTHVRNEWDAARFEFPARLFTDVGREGGVALSSDSKYGYSVRDGRIGLSLLRSPLDPDPEADQGRHEFTYALIPHAERLEDSSVRETAEYLSSAHLAVLTSGEPSFAGKTAGPAVEGDHVRMTVLKSAEDGNGRIIRLVECDGKDASVTLVPDTEGASYCECDLMENVISSAIDISKPLHFRPFEIRTLRETHA